MNQEKKFLADEENTAPAEEKQDSEAPAENSEDFLVPDDAFAPTEDAETGPATELFPQSLADDDYLMDDADDPLFTDEELASMAVKTSHAPKASNSEIPLFPSDSESDDMGDEALKEDAPAENTPRRIDGVFDILEMFVFALAFVLIAMAFCFRHSVVDGPSMMNTLQDGEHLIISSLFYTPKQGDIVVVQDASKEDVNKNLAKPIVKRVIATEGQTVKIYYDTQSEENVVYVDGVRLDEPYVYIDEYLYQYYSLETTVPEGCVFLMGDHRNNSADSRGLAGSFREEAILGKVVLRFLPINRFGAVK